MIRRALAWLDRRIDARLDGYFAARRAELLAADLRDARERAVESGMDIADWPSAAIASARLVTLADSTSASIRDVAAILPEKR